MKLCSQCKVEKPLDAFSVNRHRPDGLSGHCRSCTREYTHKRALNVSNKVIKTRPETDDRFRSYLVPVTESGCILWDGKINQGGYGVMPVKYKRLSAHRYSWEMAHGPIPDGLYVLHKCDVRMCVNPAHLFLGTQKDNMQDMAAKGRGGRIGSKRKNVPSYVVEIRKETSLSSYKIAAKYGISPSMALRIRNGTAWAHATNEERPR